METTSNSSHTVQSILDGSLSVRSRLDRSSGRCSAWVNRGWWPFSNSIRPCSAARVPLGVLCHLARCSVYRACRKVQNVFIKFENLQKSPNMLEIKCSIKPLLCDVQVHFNRTESIFDGRKVLHEHLHIVVHVTAGHITIIVMCRRAQNVSVDATVVGAFYYLQRKMCVTKMFYANFSVTLLLRSQIKVVSWNEYVYLSFGSIHNRFNTGICIQELDLLSQTIHFLFIEFSEGRFTAGRPFFTSILFVIVTMIFMGYCVHCITDTYYHQCEQFYWIQHFLRFLANMYTAFIKAVNWKIVKIEFSPCVTECYWMCVVRLTESIIPQICVIYANLFSYDTKREKKFIGENRHLYMEFYNKFVLHWNVVMGRYNWVNDDGCKVK